MQRFLVILLLLLGSGSSFLQAQAPTLQWQKQLGNRRSVEGNFAVVRTRHNRLLMGGYSTTSGPTLSAIWLLTHQGDSLRTVTFPVVAGAYSSISAIAEASNGDFLFLGYQQHRVNGLRNYSHFLLRTDSLGVQRWVQFYNTNVDVDAIAVTALADGGALLVVNINDPAGTLDTPIRVPTLLRVDSVGTVVWQRSYGRPYDSFTDIVALPDGSYALLGDKVQRLTNPVRFTTDTWILRVDLAGNVLRDRSFRIADMNVRGNGLRLGPPTPGSPTEALVLAGSVGFPAQPGRVSEGILLQLDAQDNLSWYQLVPGARSTQNYYNGLYQVFPLPVRGQYVVAGSRSAPVVGPGDSYLARYNRPAGSGPATAAWELQYTGLGYRPTQFLLEADQSLTQVGSGNFRTPGGNDDVLVMRHAGLPAVYAPALCATPPAPNATYTQPAAWPDSISVVDFGQAGPPYAQLVHWRWELGDGTVVERTTPGWVRHRYATIPAPGTLVRVTLTNNLGCTATQELYPWGRPTAAQQAQALAAAATLWPNPATGGGAVQLRVPGLRGAATAQLRDGLGRAVGSAVALHEGAATLPVAGLAAGVYVVQVRTQQGQFVKRLIVGAP